MGAISGRKAIHVIAADQAIHPIQVSQWKQHLLGGASELLTRGQGDYGEGGRAGHGDAAVTADRAVANGAGVA